MQGDNDTRHRTMTITMRKTDAFENDIDEVEDDRKVDNIWIDVIKVSGGYETGMVSESKNVIAHD